MTLSFIIPAYNEEKVINKCINSIRDEIDRYAYIDPFKDFEIIVVDNNSTDRTVELVKEYGYVKIVSEKEKGVTHARQAGYLAAKGELQAYIDADNELPVGWLDNIKYIEDPFLMEDQNVIALSGPLKLMDQPEYVHILSRVFYFINRLAHKYFGASIQGGNYIVKKSALDEIGGHSTYILFYGEDTDLAARLADVGTITLVPSMWINSSSRRFKDQGLLKTAFIYAMNYFSVHLIHRPITLSYKDIRPNHANKV